jgi:L-arabinose isomerase
VIQVAGERTRRAKVGDFGIGLEAYWEQFTGLQERLGGYQQNIEERIGQWATVVSCGLVDTAQKAYAAGERFAEERVDLIFCHAATAVRGTSPSATANRCSGASVSTTAKAGYGLSVEFGVKTGPVTIFGVTQTREGDLKMLAAEGESLSGPTLKIGNTNSRLRFALQPAAFMNAWCEQGPTHHCALGVGHHTGTLRKVARLLGLEFVEVGRS